MRVEKLVAASDFLAATHGLRASDPILTNLPASIALGVAGGRTYEAEHWWVVRDQAGEVVGCSVRTAPYRQIVSPMPAAAASALGSAVAAADPGIPGVNGPAAAVDAFYAGFGSSRPHQVTMRDVVYVLAAYAPPTGVPGAARPATLDDLDLVVEWTLQFHVDAGLPSFDVAASTRPRVAGGSIWLWEDGGRPVSMAGHADPVDSPAGAVGRIGPVYTPAQWRRNGYGSAITAAVVDALSPRASQVMLFADAANPASNSVYRRMGFRAVSEVVETELAS